MEYNDYNMLAYQFTKLEGFSYAEMDTILQGLLKMLSSDNSKFEKKKFLNKINNLNHTRNGKK